MSDLMTPRQWLASLNPPLAIYPSRGRLSAAAHEALAKAKAEGMVFADATPAKSAAPALSASVRAAKVRVNPAPVKEKPKGDADPKAVRAWAVSQNLPVAARGRVSAEMVNAYIDAMNEGGLKVEVPTDSSQDFRPSRRVRPEVMFKVTDLDNSVREVSHRTACVQCGYSFVGCFCETPMVFSCVEGSLDIRIPAVQTGKVAPAVRYW